MAKRRRRKNAPIQNNYPGTGPIRVDQDIESMSEAERIAEIRRLAHIVRLLRTVGQPLPGLQPNETE
jgi:hypothetical protein